MQDLLYISEKYKLHDLKFTIEKSDLLKLCVYYLSFYFESDAIFNFF